MKVVLITPPFDQGRFRTGESLGLRYLASALKIRGVEVLVYEPSLLGWNTQQAIDIIRDSKCDLLGISIQFAFGLPEALDVMSAVKQHCETHIAVGGHFATFHYRELLHLIPHLDTVVMFEGDSTIIELIDKLDSPNCWRNIQGIAFREDSGRICCTTPRPLITDLDLIPFPERDDQSVKDSRGYYGVLSSRGCLLNCSFCSVPAFYGKPPGPRWRARSAANVVDEIENLVRLFGATTVSFLDDNFIGSSSFGRSRAKEIAQSLAERQLGVRWSIECRVSDVDEALFCQLMRCGLSHVNLGIESASQCVLDYFQKRTTVGQNHHAISVVKKLGLSAYFHFIMFNPNSTLNELRTSLEFLKEHNIASYSTVSNRLDVYRGTGEYLRLSRKGRLQKDGFAYRYTIEDPRVESVYRIFHDGLVPLKKAELAIEGMKFVEETLYQGPPQSQEAFIMNNKDRLKLLEHITDKLSNKVAEIGLAILDLFREQSTTNEEQIFEETYSNSQSLVLWAERQLKDIYGEGKKWMDMV